MEKIEMLENSKFESWKMKLEKIKVSIFEFQQKKIQLRLFFSNKTRNFPTEDFKTKKSKPAEFFPTQTETGYV